MEHDEHPLTEPTSAEDVLKLRREVRILRVWLAVVTGTLAFLVLIPFGLAVFSVQAGLISNFLDLGDFTQSKASHTDQTKAIQSELQRAWGSALANVQITRLSASSDSAEDGPSYDVNFNVPSASAAMSFNVYDASELQDDGLLPGSDSTGLSREQYVTLLRAWSRRTSNPAAGIMPYVGQEEADPESRTSIDGVSYQTNTLWLIEDSLNQDVSIYHLDPATGTADYIGKGSSDTWEGANTPDAMEYSALDRTGVPPRHSGVAAARLRYHAEPPNHPHS